MFYNNREEMDNVLTRLKIMIPALTPETDKKIAADIHKMTINSYFTPNQLQELKAIFENIPIINSMTSRALCETIEQTKKYRRDFCKKISLKRKLVSKMKTKIFFSKKCLEYGQLAHTENSIRVGAAAKILMEKGYEFAEPTSASEEDLLSAHDPKYVEMVKEGRVEDIDTPAVRNIYDYAMLAAGAAICAAKNNGFSLMRPPGHHAGINGNALKVSTRGFCYFNNVAVAVRYVGKKTLILDIDGHHGNGTEEIFLGDERVIYLSLHRNNHYPGTGNETRENCFNFPLEADCGNEFFLKTLRHALSDIDAREIETVAVSAGFDAHDGDLASLGLDKKAFLQTGREIAKLEKPTFFVFEGGYNGKNVGEDIHELLKGFEENRQNEN